MKITDFFLRQSGTEIGAKHGINKSEKFFYSVFPWIQGIFSGLSQVMADWERCVYRLVMYLTVVLSWKALGIRVIWKWCLFSGRDFIILICTATPVMPSLLNCPHRKNITKEKCRYCTSLKTHLITFLERGQKSFCGFGRLKLFFRNSQIWPLVLGNNSSLLRPFTINY